MGKAGGEAARRVVLKTRGLNPYPPETSANNPPAPYYIRGRGTQTSTGNRFNSENLGKQWYVKRKLSEHTTEIGNRASYARWVVGEQQAGPLARIGWKKLVDVVDERMGDIRKVYQAWINKMLRDLGL
jgi:hypothetical protein